MDSFFNKDEELLTKYPEIRTMGHLDHLEMFYDFQYEDTPYDFSLYPEHYQQLYDDRVESALEYNMNLSMGTKPRKTTPEAINAEIAKLNFHKENIRLSRVSIRDMYSLLYKMGIYDKSMHECFLCKKDVTCWKRTIREERDTKILSGEASKCRQVRTRIEEG
jgi:hypothetical protein